MPRPSAGRGRLQGRRRPPRERAGGAQLRWREQTDPGDDAAHLGGCSRPLSRARGGWRRPRGINLADDRRSGFRPAVHLSVELPRQRPQAKIEPAEPLPVEEVLSAQLLRLLGRGRELDRLGRSLATAGLRSTCRRREGHGRRGRARPKVGRTCFASRACNAAADGLGLVGREQHRCHSPLLSRVGPLPVRPAGGTFPVRLPPDGLAGGRAGRAAGRGRADGRTRTAAPGEPAGRAARPGRGCAPTSVVAALRRCGERVGLSGEPAPAPHGRGPQRSRKRRRGRTRHAHRRRVCRPHGSKRGLASE
mmetsp:Transcript_18711/g.71149  ORF Transcript_18711/g.71149 Transcript_18711/m.71149 type:complete len:306 (-) Transcript_18711:613-1530(-)